MMLLVIVASLVSHLLIQHRYQSTFNKDEEDLSFQPPLISGSGGIASSPTTNPLPLIDITGIDKTIILGNSTECIDLVYTCDGQVPNNFTSSSSQNRSIVDASWSAMKELSLLPKFNQTCFCFFHLSNYYFTTNGISGLHMVWGRLPSTALAFEKFPNVQYMLYINTDAMFTSARYTPTLMYHELSKTSLSSQPRPSLIVNKPMTGWLCSQCRYFDLGHGCFNTGALLWRRSRTALLVLQRWWESRLHKTSMNLYYTGGDNITRGFYGWLASGNNANRANKMSEQNRLMYLFAKDPIVREAVLPMPRQPSKGTNTTSCPEAVYDHTPCCKMIVLPNIILWSGKMNHQCVLSITMQIRSTEFMKFWILCRSMMI